MQAIELLCPVWPAPANIVAGVTTRTGGGSAAPYDAFNLALHVQDDRQSVLRNREQLADFCRRELSHADTAAKQNWNWLEQTHGTRVAMLDQLQGARRDALPADGAISRNAGEICVVLTADCLPLLLCDRSGHAVGAVHVGWRGLVDGIVDNALQAITTASETPKINCGDLYAWLGPAIGPQKFIVGEDVRQRALTYFQTRGQSGDSMQAACMEAFTALAAEPQQGAPAARPFTVADTPASLPADTTGEQHRRYLADLYQLVSLALHRNGVKHIYGGGFCTASDPKRFFSFRRDGTTGRMASFIFICN